MLNPRDNEISKESTQMATLPSTIKAIIYPLLDGIIESGQRLTFTEFYESMEDFLKVLSAAEKNVLFMNAKPQQGSFDEVSTNSRYHSVLSGDSLFEQDA